MHSLAMISALVLVTLPCAHQVLATQVTPVAKVLEMLGEMKVKAASQMEAEQKTYATYKEWVDDTTKATGFEITTAKATIEKLLAFIAKADNDVAELGRAIASLDADIARMEADKKEGIAFRAADHEEYTKVQQDYSESVSALERAIQTLEAQSYSRPQAEALLQRMAVSVPGMPRVLAEFLQQTAHDTPGAPAVAAYKFQSDSIVEMLEKLLTKFKGELSDVESEESNKQHAFSLEDLHLANTIAYSQKDREEKAVIKAKIASESAEAKGQLSDTKSDLAADEKLLADTLATFEAKTKQFQENQQVRADELEALGKAIEIISSPSVAASYSAHVKLAQVSAVPTSLLQLQRASARTVARGRAVAFLQQRAKALSSKALTALVAQLAESPFSKVIEMIKVLIAKLKEEAAAEADHKQWCDEQLHNNKLKREKKTSEVNQLTADIDLLTSQITTMGETIERLSAEQAELTKAMAEATELRTSEKAENESTIADASAGIDAVKQALVILREFYASQTGLLQVRRQVPEMEAYKGMKGAGGGVIGMLEVIESDFVRLLAETKASESQAAAEYSTFMEDSKADKLQKHKREVQLKLDKDQAEFERGQLQKTLKMTQVELKRAQDYLAYLTPNCLEVHVSYEDRVARREEEIAALKQAYELLGGQASVLG